MTIYRVSQLKEKLHTDYPDFFTSDTTLKRQTNIKNLIDFIIQDIKENDLKNEIKERRIKLYESQDGEEIFIQYPGKFSEREEKPVLFDFKPIAILTNKEQCIDLAFDNIWSIIEKYLKQYRNLVDIINAILFRMGRMYEYEYFEDTTYQTQFILNNRTIQEAEDIHLSLYKLHFEDKTIISSLNIHGEQLNAGNGNKMSLEAFLYYLELLIQIEDCKYNSESSPKEQGRVSTTDSLIVITSCLENKLNLSDLLMRFLRGKGVAKCNLGEYSSATSNIVVIHNALDRIKKICKDNNIVYSTSTRIIDGIPKIKLAINSKRILIGDGKFLHNKIGDNYLRSNEYNYYNILDFMNSIGEIEKIILSTPDKYSFEEIIKIIKENLDKSNITYDKKFSSINETIPKEILLLRIPSKKILLLKFDKFNVNLYDDYYYNCIYVNKFINIDKIQSIILKILNSKDTYTYNEALRIIKNHCDSLNIKYDKKTSSLSLNLKEHLLLRIPDKKLLLLKSSVNILEPITISSWTYYRLEETSSNDKIEELLHMINK